MTQIQSNTARIHETSLPWRSVEAFLWHIPGFLFWFSKWQVRAMHGFNHFGYSTKSYSIWLVILMVYKPPLCMTCPSLFLTLLILGPKSPRQNIDVYLWPLVDDLKLLWEKGVHNWDALFKQNFQIWLVLLLDYRWLPYI